MMSVMIMGTRMGQREVLLLISDAVALSFACSSTNVILRWVN